METNNTTTGIVELIDRTLNKGVILNADLIITVADVPLLAANLRLALASVETMLKYGMMEDLLGVHHLVQRKDEKEESSGVKLVNYEKPQQIPERTR